MKISEVIINLIKAHPPIDEKNTIDVVKYGDPNQECTGIVVTTYASIRVIRTAIEQGANLIVVHEPLFYRDADDIGWLEDNSVFQEKRNLLDEGGIVVWRDHDHIHGGPPAANPKHTDMIYYGIMKTLGWEPYLIGNPKKPLLYDLPETTVGELARWLVEKLHLNGARIIGNSAARVKRVYLCEHISGDNFAGHDHDSDTITQAEKGGYDVLIPLEIIDWTLSEYIRDAMELGRAKALIEVGHFNLEEAGMQYLAEWLPSVIGQEIPVVFVQSGDGFAYVSSMEK